MRWTLAFLLVSSFVPAFAMEHPLAACPDGGIEAVFKTPETPEEGEEIIFKNMSSGKKIASFPCGGFGVEVPELLWSPDGRHAALDIRTTRHTRDLMVFHVTGQEVQKVQVEDFTQNINGRLGILHGSGRHANRPLRWLAPDRLLISAAGTLKDEESYEYKVEIKVIQDAEQWIGWLEKITAVKPEAE